MPVVLQEVPITSLKEYSDYVQTTVEAKQTQLWFRGCSDSSYKLLPGLYRHPAVADVAATHLELEQKLITRFRQRSIPYQTERLKEGWDELFFMQHFKVPTRLLDWTENPFVALYFALGFSTPGAVPPDAAVWVLDPTEWNRHVLQHIGFTGDILGPEDNPMKGYAPFSDPGMMATKPVAMYGNHNSPRIVAQRGAFCIFGKELNSMEDSFAVDFPATSLTKLLIKGPQRVALLRSLHATGYTESVVYPDLEGLALEFRRVFGFV